jgi:hypothetical protein
MEARGVTISLGQPDYAFYGLLDVTEAKRRPDTVP